MTSITVPVNGNEKLAKLVDQINKDKELLGLLEASNVMSIDRLGYNDHGPVHVKIVANIGLRILRILLKNGIIPSIVKDYNMTEEDAEVIVFLASVLHDTGMAAGRRDHDSLGLMITTPFLERLLEKVYPEKEKTIIKSEVMHAMLFHDTNPSPLTVEGGVFLVADALDMEKGRARIPFEKGKKDIHSVSALAVENVKIEEGTKKPIKITITLGNSAGIFQIDNLLKPRVKASGLQDKIQIRVVIKGEKEKRILDSYEL